MSIFSANNQYDILSWIFGSGGVGGAAITISGIIKSFFNNDNNNKQ
jgi:hypothetical protein